MAFRKKAGTILQYKPDILVVIECEHPDKLVNTDTHRPKDQLWFGKNQHKGLAVFSYCNYRFRVHETYNDQFQMIVPLEVTGKSFRFNLFIVWAYNPDDADGRYVTQVWKAVNYYEKLLADQPAILIGDFNSNAIWDRKNAVHGSHSLVVSKLASHHIHSVYHHHYDQLPGTEHHPTFYLYRHKDKPYHLDYCFASDSLLRKLESVEIGDYDAWTKHSDHVPVMVAFGKRKRKK